MNEIDKTSIYLMDINYFLYSGHYAVQLQSRGQAIGGTYVTVKNLLKLVKTAKRIVAVLDSDYSFKRERVATYKANRKHVPEIQYQREAIIAFLAAMNIPMCRQHGYEADDVIATLSTYYTSKEIPTVIVGVDKDLCALVNNLCFILNLQTGSVFDKAAIFSKYGVNPEKFEDYLAMVGDSSDEFKGLPGVGPKKAAELLRQHGTLHNILNNIKLIPAVTRRHFEDNDKLESLRASIMLATLDRNVPNLEDYYNPGYHSINVPKFNELCKWHGFKSLMIAENKNIQ